MDKLGVGMRVRLKLGQERMEADLAQAQKEVDDERKARAKSKKLAKDKNKSKDGDKDKETDTDSTNIGKDKDKSKSRGRGKVKGKGKAVERSASTNSVPAASSERASSLIDLSSDAEACTIIDHSDPDVTVLAGGETKMPTAKRRLVKGRKRKTPSVSQSSTDIEVTSSQPKPRQRFKKREPTLQNAPPYALRSRSTSVASLTSSADVELVYVHMVHLLPNGLPDISHCAVDGHQASEIMMTRTRNLLKNYSIPTSNPDIIDCDCDDGGRFLYTYLIPVE
jgi:hypothetical protein